jgi:hypothetical protein
MMTLFAGWIALSLLGFLVWFAAGRLLRLAHLGRLIATLAVPSLVVAGTVWFSYLQRRYPGSPGWDAVFFVVSLMAGGATTILILPICFVAEERLGWRMR